MPDLSKMTIEELVSRAADCRSARIAEADVVYNAIISELTRRTEVGSNPKDVSCEATDPNTGDRFVLRVCDDCNGLVIERFMAEHGPEEGEEWKDQYATDTLDIPPALIPWFLQAVKSSLASEKGVGRE